MCEPQPGLSEIDEAIAVLGKLKEAIVERDRAEAAVSTATEEVRTFPWIASVVPQRTAPATTNTQLYQQALLDHGRPMHVRELTEAALAHGVQLKGQGDPVEQVRNAVFASKRFENLGGNVWWVVGHPIPDGAAAMALENGKYRSCE